MIPRYSIAFSWQDAWVVAKYLVKRSRMPNKFVNSWLGSDQHQVVFTWSGRVALRLILRALNLSPNEPVVVPLWTCSQVHRAILIEGGKPCFVGISPGELMPSIDNYVEAVQKSQARILVVISYWGYPVDIAPLRERLPNDVIIVQDCALSFGSSVRGAPDGFDADLAFFSFGIGKPLCLGGGGAIIFHRQRWPQLQQDYFQEQMVPPPRQALIKMWLETVMKSLIWNSKRLYGYLRHKYHGRDERRVWVKLNTIQDDFPVWHAPPWIMELGILKTPRYHATVYERRKKWQLLNEMLGKHRSVQTIMESPNITWNYWTVPILLPTTVDADEVVKQLGKHGFEVKRAYAEATYSLRDEEFQPPPNWIVGPALDYMCEDDILRFANAVSSICSKR